MDLLLAQMAAAMVTDGLTAANVLARFSQRFEFIGLSVYRQGSGQLRLGQGSTAWDRTARPVPGGMGQYFGGPGLFHRCVGGLAQGAQGPQEQRRGVLGG
ncbi:hypothetical protein D3C78_1584570 [compost metagenome]